MKTAFEKALIVFLAVVGIKKIFSMVNQAISMFLLIIFFAICVLILLNL
jgi:hypothetical protein